PHLSTVPRQLHPSPPRFLYTTLFRSEQDRGHLRHCVALAREALEAGDQPFGSLLVDGSGAVVRTDRNRIADGDPTAHPELALALDRKSTRLNSSHVSISYAVFSLEKK